MHFFFFARREKRTRESTGTVGRSNLHDTEFSFIAINMNEHRSTLKESSIFFSVSHVTLPLYMYIDILGFLQLVNVAKKNRKKKKKYTRILDLDRPICKYRNVLTTTISSKVYRKTQVEFHSFQRMALLFFFLIQEWNDHVSSSSLLAILSNSIFATLNDLGPWVVQLHERSSFRETKDFKGDPREKCDREKLSRFENATRHRARDQIELEWSSSVIIDDRVTIPKKF